MSDPAERRAGGGEGVGVGGGGGYFSRFRDCAAFLPGAQRSGVGPGALRLSAPL